MVSLQNNFKISIRHTFDVIGKLIYFSLLCLAIYFIYLGAVIDRFALKRTNYAVFDENITELPTILTWVDIYGQHAATNLNIGRDFNMSFQHIPSGTFELPETAPVLIANGYYPVKGNKYTTFGIAFETNIHGFEDIKITPVISPGSSLTRLGDLALTYTFRNSSLNDLVSIGITLTTENNSLVGGLLMGKVQSYDGKWSEFQSRLGHNKIITYTMEKFITLQNCRRDPFNDLLFKHIAHDIETCKRPCKNTRNFGDSLNDFFNHLPDCQTEMEKECFTSVVKKVFHGIPRTPCTLVQYKGEMQDLEWNSVPNKITFYLKMGYPKKVKVHEEYLIYDMLAMISAVGGTMGLCIGFSFNDFCCFILKYFELGVYSIQRKSQVVNKRTFNIVGQSPVESSGIAIETKLTAILESQAEFETSLSNLQKRVGKLEAN